MHIQRHADCTECAANCSRGGFALDSKCYFRMRCECRISANGEVGFAAWRAKKLPVRNVLNHGHYRPRAIPMRIDHGPNTAFPNLLLRWPATDPT